ncbi:MAG: hypothetical protein Tsb002_01920 [Wenzhouxiangellaceae bacterium]
MRVDFYLLRNTRKTALSVCATLCAKAYDEYHQLAVLLPESEQPGFDALLWQQPPNRFIPHGIAGHDAAVGAPVVIGEIQPQVEALINLCGGDQPPPLPEQHRIQRILEIVDDSDAARAQARQRYRHYHQWGAELFNHEIH